MQIRKKLLISLIISFFILVFTFFISVSLGTVDVSLTQLIEIFKSIFVNSNVHIDDRLRTIILEIRLPRIVLAVLIGGGLSIVGVVMQSVFKNPMAEPGILGWSSGGAFFAVLLIYSGLAIGNDLLLPICSFFGTLLTATLIYRISTIKSETPNTLLLLTGIAVGSLFVSLISLVLIMSDVWSIREILFWLMGGLDSTGWYQVKIVLAPILFGSFAIMFFGRELNALLVSEDTASTLGIDVKSTKVLLFIFSSLVVGASVSVSGIIGFVGLIIPHFLRLIIGADNRIILPVSFLIGGAFLSLADLLARTIISPEEIRLGIITSFMGVPFFIYLLRKNRFKISGLYE
ncbi:MAG: FecCD family ABC transporter permease [Thermodesulfobacteriota bacterium]